MENFFKYILFPILVVSLCFFIWKSFFGDPTKLEQDNQDLKNKIKNIQVKKDSIQDIKDRLELKFDSIFKVGLRLDSLIKKDKEKIKIQERKLQISIDTMNFYRKKWKTNRERLEQIKKNQKVPTNEETLDFFKKY